MLFLSWYAMRNQGGNQITEWGLEICSFVVLAQSWERTSRAQRPAIEQSPTLSQFLNRALQNDAQTESRLDRLEKEVTRLKKRIVA